MMTEDFEKTYEELISEYESMKTTTIRAAAIEGFVKKLKRKKYYGSDPMGYGAWVVRIADIDNLVKEMVG